MNFSIRKTKMGKRVKITLTFHYGHTEKKKNKNVSVFDVMFEMIKTRKTVADVDYFARPSVIWAKLAKWPTTSAI